MTFSSAIYSNPLYLRQTWDSYHEILEKFINISPAITIPLDTIKKGLSAYRWDENLSYLLPTITNEKAFPLDKTLRAILSDLSDHNHFEFGTGDRDPGDSRYNSVFSFTLRYNDEDISVRDITGKEEVITSLGVSFSSAEDVLDPFPESQEEQHLWETFYFEKALSSLLSPVAAIQEKGIALLRERAAGNPAKLMENLNLLVPGKEIHSALFTIIRLRLINFLILAACSDDPWGTHDWTFSPDSPFFTGPNAAVLTTNLSFLAKDGKYPDFFAGAATESPAS